MGFDLSKLGVTQNIPQVSFTDYSGLIIAEPKFGKTTMASLYPKAVIVPFEKGYQATVSNVLKKLDDWDDFISFVDNLEENREEIGDDLITIVFDTINEAYKMCEPYTLRQLSISDKQNYRIPGDVPHGKFYSERDKIFEIQLKRLFNLGFMPLFITHSSVKTINPKDGESYQVYGNTMPDRLQGIINPLVSYIVYGQRTFLDDGKGGKIPKRMIVTKSDEMTTAGSRVRLDHNIVFDTEVEAMEKFQAAFKQSVQKTLDEAGITTSIEVLEDQQHKEKGIKIKETVDKLKADLPTLIKKILDTIGEKVNTQGMAVESVMSILGEFKVTDPNTITDIEVAKAILKKFK
mgnify:CR=1 FL=1